MSSSNSDPDFQQIVSASPCSPKPSAMSLAKANLDRPPYDSISAEPGIDPRSFWQGLGYPRQV